MLTQLFTLLPLLAVASAGPIHLKRATSRLIQSGRNPEYCLSIQGGRQAVGAGRIADGTPVTTLFCSAASFWDISPGSGSVIVSGTNYALDIGLNPGNNGPIKVWTSYPGAPQQTWYLTDDARIAQTGGTQCLDQGDSGTQTYQCTPLNTNQVWNVRFNDVGPSSSASVAPSASSSSSAAPSASASPAPGFLSDIPVGVVNPDVAGRGVRIRPAGRDDLSLGVTNGFAGVGTPVAVLYGTPDNTTFADLQEWDVPSVGTTGPIRLHFHPTLCMDAGSNPANGVGLKIWTCYDGLGQQQWTNNGDGTFTTINNQAIDIVKESGPNLYTKPYSSYKSVATWVRSNNGDPYQAFDILGASS